MDMPKASAPKSEAQISFDTLKSLAGNWEGPVNVPEVPEMSGGNPIHLSMRVTSRGNTLVHEFQEAGTPLDPTKYDHPVTMLYLDGDPLTLVHYCDAGNRPRMTGKASPGRQDAGIRVRRHHAATRSTDTCTTRCSPWSTRTTTSKTGPTWRATSRSTRISTCSGLK